MSDFRGVAQVDKKTKCWLTFFVDINRRNILVLAFVSASFISPSTGEAGLNDIANDVWGIVTDPLKIGKGTENLIHAVERAGINAERLEGKTNEDFKARIDQINYIIKETRKDFREGIDKIEEIANTSFNQITELETKIFSDAAELVKCSVVTTKHEMQTAIADSLNKIGKRKPRFVIFGWEVGSVKFEPEDIETPMESFRTIKKEYQGRWSRLKLSDHPQMLTDGYSELQRIADLTRCHFKHDTGAAEELWFWEIEFNRREDAWRGAVKFQ